MRHGAQIAGFAKKSGEFFFMLRISEREKEANGNGIRFGAADYSQDAAHFLVGQTLDNRAVPCKASGRADAIASCNQGFWFLHKKVVELRSRLPSNFENVFESRGGYQGDVAAAAFEQSIGADSRPANQIKPAIIAENLGRAKLFAGLTHRRSDRFFRHGRLRRNFQNLQFPVTHEDAIGECSPGVDGDPHEAALARPTGRRETDSPAAFLGSV